MTRSYRFALFSLLACALFALAACGNKGPLVKPQAKTPTSAPVEGDDASAADQDAEPEEPLPADVDLDLRS